MEDERAAWWWKIFFLAREVAIALKTRTTFVKSTVFSYLDSLIFFSFHVTSLLAQEFPCDCVRLKKSFLCGAHRRGMSESRQKRGCWLRICFEETRFSCFRTATPFLWNVKFVLLLSRPHFYLVVMSGGYDTNFFVVVGEIPPLKSDSICRIYAISNARYAQYNLRNQPKLLAL